MRVLVGVAAVSVALWAAVEMFSRRARLGWDTWGNESLGHVEMEAASA